MFSIPMAQTAAAPSAGDDGPAAAEQPPARRLRNRRINLNELSSELACPLVCRLPNCGMRLKDAAALRWHYEGHLGQEMERLDRMRLKRPPPNQDAMLRRRVRDSAVDRIKTNREKRQERQTRMSLIGADRGHFTQSTMPECPVCEVEVDDVEFVDHLESCLRTFSPQDDDDGGGGSEYELEVDGVEGYETYTWAGHTRVRATSLVEGGLRGSGFVTITRGDEDAELDIENDDDNRGRGSGQYSEADVIVPPSESAKEKQERLSIAQVLVGCDATKAQQPSPLRRSPVEGSPSSDKSPSEMSVEELRTALEEAREESGLLRRQALCNICFDSYSVPVASVICWHVHCEQCWLRALGSKKLCPQCKVITQPRDLRRIYL